MARVCVSDLMTRNVVTAREEESLQQVRDDMRRGHLRHVPVVSGDKLVGLLSHGDLLRYSTSELDSSPISRKKSHHFASEVFVASVMTTDVRTVRPDTSVMEAVELLLSNRFGCLPVVDEEQHLVGIVTEYDLLKELARRLTTDNETRLGDSWLP